MSILYVYLSVCTNRWTEMVLLYNVASNGPGKVYNYFWEGTTTHTREIASNT